MLRKYPLIIMAGSDSIRSDELLDYANVDYKALIELNGKTLLEYIIDAMQKSDVVSHIYVIGIPEDKINLSEYIQKDEITYLEIPGESVPNRLNETAKRMMADANKNSNIFPGGSFHGLFIGGDVPFLKPQMIRDFVESIGEPELDLYPSFVRKEVMEKRFPESRRTYGKLTDGHFCLGDITCLDLSMVDERLPQVRILRKNRKKFVTTLLKFAPLTAVRFVFRRMSIKHLENGTNKVFKIKCKFIEVQHAELAMDIDKPAQLDLAREEFRKLK